MKKLFIVTCLALLLVGCSSAGTTKLSSGDEVLWSSPKESYTKQNLYEDMKNYNDYSSVISKAVLKTIAEIDGLDLEAETKKLEEQYDSYIEMLGDYAVQYFGNKEYYVSMMLGDSLVSTYMINDINSDFNKYVSENNPYYATIFYVAEQEMADEIKSAVEEGKNTLEYAATNAGYNDTVAPRVYTDKSDLPLEVKEIVLNNNAPYFTVLPVDTFATDSDGNTSTTTRYYIISINSKDATEFKDEFIDTLVSETNKTEYIQKLISTHDVRFHDQSAYESFSSVYEGAK